jgi:hypothetical protein
VAEEALAAFVRRVSLGAATECRGPFSEVDSFDSQQGNEEGSEKAQSGTMPSQMGPQDLSK